jgi:hypothetical protein
MPKTPSKMGQLLRQDHAQVAWRAEDVLTLRPKWSAEKANEWLMDNEDHIQCAMIERGWVAIESLLPEEEE